LKSNRLDSENFQLCQTKPNFVHTFQKNHHSLKTIIIHFKMPIEFYDITIKVYLRGLKVLTHLLDKAKAHAEANGIPLDDVVEWRLVDDMLPLRFQVQTCCNTSKNALRTIMHLDPPAVEDNEKTFADLEARIKATEAILEKVDPASVNGNEDKLSNPPDSIKKFGDFTGLQLALGQANHNFYFHLMTAYNILRAKGVDVGKKDFLRPGVLPLEG
jgi:uncharacterized protein